MLAGGSSEALIVRRGRDIGKGASHMDRWSVLRDTLLLPMEVFTEGRMV